MTDLYPTYRPNEAPEPPVAQPPHAAGQVSDTPSSELPGNIHSASAEPLPFRFTGSGSEYFRIWIVNLLLTIVTLGIYSAWAKVRKMQYFYRSTEVAHARFDYHGAPWSILKGRIIAFILLVGYHYAVAHLGPWAIFFLVVLALAMPWLLWKSIKFRLAVSSYRGLRFRFVANPAKAYYTFLWLPVLVIFTAGLALPFAHQQFKKFQIENARFGRSEFSFSASAWSFYKVYLWAFGLVILIYVIFFAVLGALFGLALSHPTSTAAAIIFIAVGVVALYAFLLFIQPYIASRTTNLAWRHTHLDTHPFDCHLQARRLFWIYLTNLFAIVLTLGLYTPFAQIRLAKYRIEQMAILPMGSLDEFLADRQQEVDAAGEGAADLFDIDLAL